MVFVDDPWGSDDDTDHEQRVKTRSIARSLCVQKTKSDASGSGDLPTRVPTLYLTCVAVLLTHVEDAVELPAECIESLPPDCKAALLAVASRLHILNDSSLAMLADDTALTLSLHTTTGTTLITERGILEAASRMPDLRFLDVTGHKLRAKTIKTLAQLCPNIEVLRIGGCSLSTEAISHCMIDVLPALEKDENAALDSWDALLVDNTTNIQTTTTTTTDTATTTHHHHHHHRFQNLKCLCWPEMPTSARIACKAAAPIVLINPTSEEVVGPTYSQQCRPDVDFDETLLGNLPGGNWLDIRPAVDSGKSDSATHFTEVHIAEKFRLAYISRDRRIYKKLERNYWQEKRKKLRESPAAQIIKQWENEL